MVDPHETALRSIVGQLELATVIIATATAAAAQQPSRHVDLRCRSRVAEKAIPKQF